MWISQLLVVCFETEIIYFLYIHQFFYLIKNCIYLNFFFVFGEILNFLFYLKALVYLYVGLGKNGEVASHFHSRCHSILHYGYLAVAKKTGFQWTHQLINQ